MALRSSRVFSSFFIFGAVLNCAGGGVVYDPEASITGLYTGPYFDPLAPRNLTAHIGDRAVLPCTVRQLGDKSVSWVRMRDADILTVDRYTFVGDERFEAQYSSVAETWNLVINYVQKRDAGDYECQVSTEPKMSQFFNLRVVVPQVNIEPPDDRHVKAGSKVRIDCHITDVVEMPDYIFWYHDTVRVLDRTDSNLDVTLKRTGEESLLSSLHIERVEKKQSGNYTCMPSNLHGAFTLLHVLNEEHPAAMQDGRNSAYRLRASSETLILTLCLLLLVYLETSDKLKCFSRQPRQEHPSRMHDQTDVGEKTGHCLDKILGNTKGQIIQKTGSQHFPYHYNTHVMEYMQSKYSMGERKPRIYYAILLEFSKDPPNETQTCKIDDSTSDTDYKAPNAPPLPVLSYEKHHLDSMNVISAKHYLNKLSLAPSEYTRNDNNLPFDITEQVSSHAKWQIRVMIMS